jgi:uncharacterized membrane protein YbhN (UPF0104 family)
VSRPLRLLSLLAAAAGAVYLAYLAWQAGSDLWPGAWGADRWWALARATGFYLLALLLSATAWHWLLRALGAPLPARRSVAIFLCSQPARYLPGNVAHYIGRLVLARRAGVPADTVVASLLVEAAVTIVVGALVAAATLRDQALPAVPAARWLVPVAAGLAVVAVAVVVHRRLPPIASALPWGGRLGLLAVCSALYLAVFCAHGGAAVTLSSALYGDAPWRLLTGCFALAWLAGFLTPGVPAGLGVREAIFAALVAPRLGAAAAIALPLAMRLATILGDALAFPAGLALRRSGGSGDLAPLAAAEPPEHR